MWGMSQLSSHLTPGVYYVHVGGKVQEFLIFRSLAHGIPAPPQITTISKKRRFGQWIATFVVVIDIFPQ
jgi:hypothetical protein